MNALPPETRALRQMICVGILSFFVGVFGFLLLVGWSLLRFVEHDTPWHTLLHIAIHALVISVVAGLAVAAGAISVLNWIQYRCGMYRCFRCGRPLPGPNVPCDCLSSE